MPPSVDPIYRASGTHPMLPHWVSVTFQWLDGQPVLSGLLMLMVLDIIMGLCVAVAKKELNSTVSWKGMSKKAATLLIVGACKVLQPFIPNVPVLSIVAVFYILTEAISILENAAAIGVPLPNGLVEVLFKMREARKLKDKDLLELKKSQAMPTINNITVVNSPPLKDGASVTTTTTDEKSPS